MCKHWLYREKVNKKTEKVVKNAQLQSLITYLPYLHAIVLQVTPTIFFFFFSALVTKLTCTALLVIATFFANTITF